ncbi:organic hydroperoxide reductase OsmC/OhrA [Stella humosa]|uniref:Organic hydroperoxide reductase OsmC/OhrA n=1 Tax=Stella humosa TaxID=94 RepID=A0A3N1KZR3_9PROT|nr:OsmC family protein [Stella humosa]ROP83818.1 organic hydroperoxide reductase OsmC/OhrA [Stella humosa]BBK32921.1 peroxiredoxin [Stella humosa]
MSSYEAEIVWQRGEQNFADGRYSRGHEWRFDGGQVVPASSSPHVVRVPYSVAENVDPEEAFVAAISSCHMLFFLNLAQKRGIVVDAYRDAAIGHMEKNAAGRMAMTRVVLRPRIAYSGTPPSAETVAEIHHESHELCFIANSVTTEITVE